MLSLYIHIPFCDQKCWYCSFQVIPKDTQGEEIFTQYTEQICKELKERSEKQENLELKTIYFGGGTPAALGKDNLIKIMDAIEEYYDCENVEELSMELNPYPDDEVFDLITTFQKKYKHYPRIRRSIGLQTFDIEILKESGRLYSFPGIVDFLRELRSYKNGNTVFNFDFIAFGKYTVSKKWNKQLWDTTRLNFFENFIHSGFADSFSLYTLELFPGSDRYQQQKMAGYASPWASWLKKYGTDDEVHEEFTLLKNIILDAGYQRYEISNFAVPGKRSLHNMMYREMGDYIGVWTSASSFCDNKRWTNTHGLVDYLKWNRINPNKTLELDEKDILIESFFLSLRTDIWIVDLSHYESVLVENREAKITQYQKAGLLFWEEDHIILSDEGMDVFNSIVTELLKEI